MRNLLSFMCLIILIASCTKKPDSAEIVKIEPEVQTVKQEPVIEERYERPKRKKIKRLEIRVVNNKRRLNYD